MCCIHRCSEPRPSPELTSPRVYPTLLALASTGSALGCGSGSTHRLYVNNESATMKCILFEGEDELHCERAGHC